MKAGRFPFSLFIFFFLWAGTLQIIAQTKNSLTLLFTGDIMGHDTQIESARMMGEGAYDYSSCFAQIKPLIHSADIAIGNLEVTLAGAPYKGYPAFSSPDELAMELRKSGFDILVNANNHALDRRRDGLLRTLSVLDSLGLVQTGVFRDSAERALEYPLVVEKNNIRLAFLNYTYGTNGIKVPPPSIVNYIDTLQIKKDLTKALSADPDFLIALMHWGKEYERTENELQQSLARFLFRNGADAIIGSHPHVVQPVRMYPENKLVAFSLGNMISNQRKRYTDGGILFGLTLEKNKTVTVADYGYLPIWVYKAKTEKGTAFSLVHAAIDSIHYRELGFNGEDKSAMNQFLLDTRENLKGIQEYGPEFQFKR